MNPRSHSDSLVAALSSAAPEDRLRALVSIIETPPSDLPTQAVAALTNCLSADSKTIRRRAADALATAARRHPPVAAALRSSLASPERRIRFGAAYALGAIDGELTIDAAPALCEALGDSDGDVRWAAAELILRLGRMNREKIHADLIALARSGNSAARKMAVYCLRDLGAGGADTLDVAAAAVRDRDAHVRLAALALLSEAFKDSEAAAALVVEKLDSDPEPGVRRAAAVALGNMHCRSPHAIEILTRASAQSSDESLARAAGAALDRLARS